MPAGPAILKSVNGFGRHARPAPRFERRGGALLAAIAALALAACTTPPAAPEARAAYDEANDPIEPTNRDIFDVNLALDENVVKPVAKAYRVVPEDARKGLHNMIETVRSPSLIANEVMQGDADSAADTVLRLVINLTVGLGGFFDVAASKGGLPAHDTDFGVTLATWGFGEGPYLMLPLFGPSNPRDAVGLAVDNFLDPIGYFATFGESAGRFIFEGIDKREPLIEPLDEIERTSLDYYATIRSLYRQRRADLIRGGKGTGNYPAPAISEDAPPDMPESPAALLSARQPAGTAAPAPTQP